MNGKVVELQYFDFLTAFRASPSNYTVPVTAFAYSWSVSRPIEGSLVTLCLVLTNHYACRCSMDTLGFFQFLIDYFTAPIADLYICQLSFSLSRLEPTRRGANVVDPEFLPRYAKLYSILVFGKLYILVS